MAEAFNKIFTDFQWYYIIDIILVIGMVYLALVFLKRAGFRKFAFILLAIGILFAAGKVLAEFLPGTSVLVTVAGFSVFTVCAVIFAPELRRGVVSLNIKHGGHTARTDGVSEEEMLACVNEIVRAVLTLAKNNVGALIVFCADEVPQVVESGTKLDAMVSGPLLSSIFNIKAPLHDGAVVILKNRIVAAGCFLPLSQDLSIPKELGTRHRAGLGVAEAEKVLVVIVSEETGVISIAERGELLRYCDGAILTNTLESFYGLRSERGDGKKKRR